MPAAGTEMRYQPFSMPSAREEYELRRLAALGDDARLDPWSAACGHGRVVLVAAALALLGFTGFGQVVPLRGAYAVLLAAFVGLGVVHSRIERRRRAARRRAAQYARAIDRLDGKWMDFVSTGEALANAQHPYARDLDVVGRGSLFQLLDTTRTKQGERALGAWLLSPGELAEVESRRRAAQALATDLDARERLALAGTDEVDARIDEGPIESWAEGPALLVASRALRIAAFALPAIFVTTILLFHFDLLPYWTPIATGVVELALLRLHRDAIKATAAMAMPAEYALSQLLPLLIAARALPVSTAALEKLHARLDGAILAIQALTRRVTAFQSRANLFVALLGPFLLWDLHAAMALESWRARHGRSVRDWFQALGEAEALSALATYVFEHPLDAWPELIGDPPTFEAEDLGHPLLPIDRCVRNDVRLDGKGTALLVTGSNMSGKSTLLRACGLSVVMALAGLPVRAKRLKVSRVQLATCMRVADSLQEGQSYFLAEVRRLKQVVDLARAGAPELFLLDEILQGTNTRERSLGARGVVRRLVELGATGLVSTHDLSLVQLGEALGSRLKFAHFTDQVAGDRMSFDYRMRPGVVQSSNALRVMRANGLDVDVPDD